MRNLSAQQILMIWERGLGRSALDRALIILAAAFPEHSPEDWSSRPIGQRDAGLLDVWKGMFGSQASGYAECPQCREPLEFTLPIDDIQCPGCPVLPADSGELSTEGFDLRFRLPNSQDLAAAAQCADILSGRHRLLERCVLSVSCNGSPAALDKLPEEVLTRLAAYMLECDPQAEVRLDFRCPACGSHWPALFDIGAFLWAELAIQAKRLLREIHILARAYAWSESDILSMSACRRQCYLEMVTS